MTRQALPVRLSGAPRSGMRGRAPAGWLTITVGFVSHMHESARRTATVSSGMCTAHSRMYWHSDLRGTMGVVLHSPTTLEWPVDHISGVIVVTWVHGRWLRAYAAAWRCGCVRMRPQQASALRRAAPEEALLAHRHEVALACAPHSDKSARHGRLTNDHAIGRRCAALRTRAVLPLKQGGRKGSSAHPSRGS
jgi:hypothetical protein